MESSTNKPIIAIAIITAICLAGDSMLYIVLPTHWKEVGLTSLVQVGILLSVNRFVRLPLNPIMGFMYRRVNFRNGILLAVLLSGITSIGYGFVQNFTFWIILRSLWGFAWSLFKLGAYLLILELSNDSNRGKYMGTYNGLYRVGSLFGMLLGGFFADLFGMRVISLVIGLSAFISIPILFHYIPKTLQTYEQSEKTTSLLRHFQSFLNRRLITLFVTAFLLVMLLDGMLTATLSHIIEEKFTNKIHIFGVIVGAASLAGVIQALRWGIGPFIVPKFGNILDKIKQKHIFLTIFLICAFIMLMIIPLELPLQFWLPLLFFHVLISSILTMTMDAFIGAYASKVNNKVLIMTTFTVIVDLGAALGPITGYSLEETIGLTNLFWLAAGICLLLSIAWVFPMSKEAKESIAHPM